MCINVCGVCVCVSAEGQAAVQLLRPSVVKQVALDPQSVFGVKCEKV